MICQKKKKLHTDIMALQTTGESRDQQGGKSVRCNRMCDVACVCESQVLEQ
jgi:hypothetical protein